MCSGSSDSTLKVWDMKTKKLLYDLPGHADEVYILIKKGKVKIMFYLCFLRIEMTFAFHFMHLWRKVLTVLFKINIKTEASKLMSEDLFFKTFCEIKFVCIFVALYELVHCMKDVFHHCYCKQHLKIYTEI